MTNLNSMGNRRTAVPMERRGERRLCEIGTYRAGQCHNAGTHGTYVKTKGGEVRECVDLVCADHREEMLTRKHALYAKHGLSRPDISIKPIRKGGKANG